jgi:hypothetical protein
MFYKVLIYSRTKNSIKEREKRHEVVAKKTEKRAERQKIGKETGEGNL